MVKALYSIEFMYTEELDRNRIDAVVSSQMDWAEDVGYWSPEDTHFISVFEVLAVMAIDAEEEIMTNEEYGDRTWMWFWDMVKNLGLNRYTNVLCHRLGQRIFERDIDNIISVFLNRDYDPDGSNGGAFIIKHPREDLRDVQLWQQMMWWLSERYPDEL